MLKIILSKLVGVYCTMSLLSFSACYAEKLKEGTGETIESSDTLFVSSVDDLKALGELDPGSVVIWKNGNYSDQLISFKGHGTAEQPIIFQAETPGGVVFEGKSRLAVLGEHVLVKGFFWDNPIPESGQSIIKLSKETTYVHLYDCAIDGSKSKEDDKTDTKWVSIYGRNNTIENCTLKDKRNIGTQLVVWMEEGVVPSHLILNNHFERPITLKDRKGKALNGQETIRIGTSDYSMQDARCMVKGNYFYHCHGEQAEIISNKSGYNMYDGNLFVASQGTLTMRHGNNCVARNNIFIGEGMPGTGGVRLIGENHLVENNYFEDLAGTGFRAAICLVRAQESPKLNGYWQVKKAMVRNNSIIGCRYALNVNYGDDELVIPVISSVIQNNLVMSKEDDYAVNLITNPMAEIRWINNLIYGGKQQGIKLDSTNGIPSIPNVDAEVETIKASAGVSWDKK